MKKSLMKINGFFFNQAQFWKFFSSVFLKQAIRPNMRTFLHTVQKNQMLMMTPNSLGRSAVIKSFIKHTTPLRVDPKVKQTLSQVTFKLQDGEYSALFADS